MLALKDISGIEQVLGSSPIAQTPLWNMPIDKILPAQLIAFRKQMSMEGQQDQADAAIDYLLRQVSRNVTSREVAQIKMLEYTEPCDLTITSHAFVDGLEQFERPAPAAILFGLELGLRSDEVITLRWPDALMMMRRGELTERCRQILAKQPRHIASDYVFWVEGETRPMPLFGLDQQVFDVYGLVWGQLQAAYRRMILTH